jgi:hypothetical protein
MSEPWVGEVVWWMADGGRPSLPAHSSSLEPGSRLQAPLIDRVFHVPQERPSAQEHERVLAAKDQYHDRCRRSPFAQSRLRRHRDSGQQSNSGRSQKQDSFPLTDDEPRAVDVAI